MSDNTERLSAFIDGELPAKECEELKAELVVDSVLRAELQELQRANDAASRAFDEMLKVSVPPSLVAAIQSYQPQTASNQNYAPRAAWYLGIAASVLIALFLGYGVGVSTSPTLMASNGGWLEDIADYHAVYEGQKRHLVEVSATESDHIETWLGKTVGVEFTTPDLSDFGLTYQGARLLVATGKPVAQLIYTDVDGVVVALCMIAAKEADQLDFASQMINGYQMTSWNRGNAGYVVVTSASKEGVQEIAKNVQQQV
ncbi:anti-sigma factor family protein [Epibacterium sp. Ofav1-8]|uniref:anti-sigma factor family protein n=1 Tax=Epibacterium sp. Ofav1-8 TaxID=2917735 RepID=UPI001EF5EB25|nr:anti-sigma factor [Epibacterium sp. Ofav1-8]MCG7626098.1 anti-sigma factor [Epibacterium sp. Ofav1-8]